MKRTLLALGLSALTLVGGHFYNRRWDRAVLIFVALMLWAVAAYVAFTIRVSDTVSTESSQTLGDIVSFHWQMFLYGILALWVVSLVVTFLDARKSTAADSHYWTASGIIAALGLSFVSVLLLGIPALSLLTVTTHRYVESDAMDSGSEPRSARMLDRRFFNYVHLGRASGTAANLSKPPSGSGYLLGRFTYDDKPAPGVSLSLVLNGEYETEHFTTDESGIFTLRLPIGEWLVNRLMTHSWAKHPGDGKFMIVSGTEPKLSDGEYDPYYWIQREGIKVNVSDQAGDPQLNFTIRKRIALTWPRADEKSSDATYEEAVISWEPYPGAETYLLKITELEREGRTTSFLPVTVKSINDSTQFALLTLPAVPGEEEREYSASIMAFGKDGTFLSESSEYAGSATFKLTDKRQLLRDEVMAFAGGDLTTEELQQIRENRDRIEAIEVLLKDDMIDEAERLLDKIEGQVDPGKRKAIAGYLMAKRGRCAEAKRLFSEARSQGGDTCVPAYYEQACPD